MSKTLWVGVSEYSNEQEFISDSLEFSGKLIITIDTWGSSGERQEKAKEHIFNEVNKICSKINNGELEI